MRLLLVHGRPKSTVGTVGSDSPVEGVGSNGCGYLLDKVNGRSTRVWVGVGGDRWLAKADRLPAIAAMIGRHVVGPLVAAARRLVGAAR